jgi:hypothetical protein
MSKPWPNKSRIDNANDGKVPLLNDEEWGRANTAFGMLVTTLARRFGNWARVEEKPAV